VIPLESLEFDPFVCSVRRPNCSEDKDVEYVLGPAWNCWMMHSICPEAIVILQRVTYSGLCADPNSGTCTSGRELYSNNTEHKVLIEPLRGII
jgi:hypothetical protein